MRQVFEFIHFGWLNEKKRYWSVSPSPPLPSLSKYLPRAGSKRAYIHFANRNYLFSVIVPLVQGKILWTRHDGNREKRRTNTDSGIKRLKWTISFYDDVYIVFQFFFFFSFSSLQNDTDTFREWKTGRINTRFEELLEF